MPHTEPSRLEARPPFIATHEHFACTFHDRGPSATWVSAHGELDVASAPEFTHTLHQALKRAPLVIVDLRPLTFIDSLGLRAIVAAEARARAIGHRMVFTRNPGQVSRLFEVTGLAARLTFVDLTPTVPRNRFEGVRIADERQR